MHKDERTSKGWPLPFKSNDLYFDVERLRETFHAIDEALSLLEQNTHTLLNEKVAGIEEKQFILDERMDVIAGQATEDTEILDARIDADNEIHPNLGHNIRNLHSKLLELKAQLAENIAQLKAYSDDKNSELHDYIDEAKSEQAVTNTELKAHTDELADYEARQRKNSDEDLMQGISRLGEAVLQTNLTLNYEAELQRDNLQQEKNERIISDKTHDDTTDVMRHNLDDLSEAVILHSVQAHKKFSSQSEELAVSERLNQETHDNLTRGLNEVSYGVLQNAACLSEQTDRLRSHIKGDIVSWNNDVLTAVNAASRFGIQKEGSKQFTMLCLADVHAQTARMEAGIKYLNAIDAIDCGCCLGDLQNNFANTFAWYEEAVKGSNKPFYTVMGNHEMGDGATRSKGATVDSVFRKYFSPVSNLTGIKNLTKAYYRVDWEKYDISLIVLNGYCGPEDTDENGEFIYREVTPYFGQEQISWLIRELNNIPTKNSLIILLHMQDFEIEVISNEFSDSRCTGKTYGGSVYPYGKNGILQDIIEAWRLGKKLDQKYEPQDSSGVTETISVKCDYRWRGKSDFICWLAGHHHRDMIGRSVKYPAQLVVHLCSTVGGSRAKNSDLPRVEGTRSEDAITVFAADKINRCINLVRIGSDVTVGMSLRKITSLSWEYEEPEAGLTEFEFEQKSREENDDYLAHALHEVSLGLLQAQINSDKAIQIETTERKAEDKILKETNAETNSKVDEVSEGLIQTELNLHDWFKKEQNKRENSDERLSEKIEHGLDAEQAEREANDNALQETDRNILRGLDEISEGAIQNSLTIKHEAEQRRKLEQVVAAIKSPVDWSKSSRIQIPEPRCAVVNFSGLTSMPASKTTDVQAVMEFWDMHGNFFRKNISCAAQGDSSMGYPKKNVKFDMLNDDGSEFEIKIGCWPVQDGFHLKAYYTDFFRGVGAVSYKLCDEIMQFNGILDDRPYKKILLNTSRINTNGTYLNNPDDLTLQTDTGALCHPDGFPCIVYLNGDFYGIFSWQIKKHRANYHLTKSSVRHIHLDGHMSSIFGGAVNWTAFEIRNPNKLFTMDGKKYNGDAPKELIDETSDKYEPENNDHIRSVQVKRYILSLVTRFAEFKRNPTREKFEEIFDWENQRDYLIFSDIIKNSDGFAKNWQWFTYDGIKWFVGAYDLDMSFGGHWQGTNITAPLNGHITASTAIPTGYVTTLYKSELEERYRELRDARIIDAEHIVRILEDWTQRISTENYRLEFERWPGSPCINYYTDSIFRVRKWLDTEIANMDRLYHYVPYETRLQTRLRSADVYSQMETSERKSADVGIYRQMNMLSELIIQTVIELQDIKTTLKDWVEAANVIYEMAADTGRLTYMGARIASGNAITTMLSDVLSGTDTGEVSESEIPEALLDQITTPEEVGAMLSEIFSH